MKISKEEIISFFDELFPHAKCELNYSKDYELLFAVILSAQATDKSVNKVTDELFKKYPTLDSFCEANVEDVEKIIHSVGLSNNKSKNIVNTAKELKNKFNGVVPSTREELMSLSGVGRKTANVVLIEFFKQPEMPVDTHVERVSKRLKIAKKDDTVLEVEKKINKLFSKSELIKLHHQFIFFGRYFCKSQRPNCIECKLKHLCSYYKNVCK